MIKLKLLALGIIIVTFTGVAKDTNLFSLGVDVVNSPYKQYDHDLYLVPSITYEDDNLWFQNWGGGYYLWNDSTDKLSVMAYYDPICFKPGDSGNHQLGQLNKRYSSLMAGLSYVHNTKYGLLRTLLAVDTLNNHNGFVWDLAWLYHYTNGILILTPGLGIFFNSEDYNSYYYGVSDNESRRSWIKRYYAGAGYTPYLELTARYKIAADWSVYVTGRYEYLNDKIKNSPMVDNSWTGRLSTGVTHTF